MNERVRELRKALNMTLEVFGAKIGIKKSSLSQIENGVNNLTEQNILLICKEFNINEEWLRTGEGEMFKQFTEQEKLMKYTALLLKDNNSAVVSAIQALIITYEKLDDASKSVLEKIALQYIENLKSR